MKSDAELREHSGQSFAPSDSAPVRRRPHEPPPRNRHRRNPPLDDPRRPRPTRKTRPLRRNPKSRRNPAPPSSARRRPPRTHPRPGAISQRPAHLRRRKSRAGIRKETRRRSIRDAKGQATTTNSAKQIKGRPVRDLLAESLPNEHPRNPVAQDHVLGSERRPRFIRPIRWIVALLDDEIIPFEIAGVKSGNITRGHRVLGNAQIQVDYGSVESELRSNMVILGASERRNKIEKEAKALGATLDPDLLETLTYITEYPAAIRGDFDPAYLELPAEVLTMVMRHHQKYFAVETAPGVLAPHFVAVMNIPATPTAWSNAATNESSKPASTTPDFSGKSIKRKSLPTA